MRIFELTEENRVWPSMRGIENAVPGYLKLIQLYESVVEIPDRILRNQVISVITDRDKQYQDLIKAEWADESDPDVQQYRNELISMCVHLKYMKTELRK